MATALPAAARVALLAWYDARGRTLAFRATRDPWAILVSEVMAQQTQISRVVPAWQAFMRTFPEVADVARSTPAEILRAWQGLGYDRRALNLRRAAQAILATHGGIVPADAAALEKLPGIGPYTARAVAAIAFGQPVGAVDTNVRRVVTRMLALGRDTAPARRFAETVQSAADASVVRERPADWTHAVMDLGATVCRPANPLCESCPLMSWCATRGMGERSSIPQRGSRREATAFPSTTRWLRGRILDRLRAVDGEAWLEITSPIGSHDAHAIASALDALEREGSIERERAGGCGARLAIA